MAGIHQMLCIKYAQTSAQVRVQVLVGFVQEAGPGKVVLGACTPPAAQLSGGVSGQGALEHGGSSLECASAIPPLT